MCNPTRNVVRNVIMRSILAISFLFAAALNGQNLIVNGGFEQNGGVGTNSFNGWTVVDQSGGSGSWFAQTGNLPLPKTYRCTDDSVDAPPSGFAAMTTQSERGSHLLYQDVTIPATASKVTLSFDLFISSSVGFSTPPSLDYLVKPNTQVRVDVMDPAAPVFDAGSGVLANVYQTKLGDVKYSPYQTFISDLTPFVGRTVRLRFAQVDNVDCFNAGVDNVAINVTSCPSAAPAPFTIDVHCDSGCETGVPVSFAATHVAEACDAYAWTFGDGTSSASATPEHTFAAPGTYDVTLAITNALGSNSAHTSVTIALPPPRRRTARH